MSGSSPDMSSSSGSRSSNSSSSSSDDSSAYHVAWRICGPQEHLPTENASLLLLWFSPSRGHHGRFQIAHLSRALARRRRAVFPEAMITRDNKALYTSFKVTANEEAPLSSPRPTASKSADFVGRRREFLTSRSRKTSVRRNGCPGKETDALFKGVEKKSEGRRQGGDGRSPGDLGAALPFSRASGNEPPRRWKKLESKSMRLSLESARTGRSSPYGYPQLNTGAVAALEAGLRAELEARYADAEQAYAQAVEATRQIPLPCVFSESSIGTRRVNGTKLAASLIACSPTRGPVARAVALHGLGKMTIHAGRFARGLELFRTIAGGVSTCRLRTEISRSIGSRKKRRRKRPVSCAKPSRLTQTIATTRSSRRFTCGAGHKEEAARIARKTKRSWKRATILRRFGPRSVTARKRWNSSSRQFYAYEKFEPVRAMEMKEAREDYMFVSLHAEAAFTI